MTTAKRQLVRKQLTKDLWDLLGPLSEDVIMERISLFPRLVEALGTDHAICHANLKRQPTECEVCNLLKEARGDSK